MNENVSVVSQLQFAAGNARYQRKDEGGIL